MTALVMIMMMRISNPWFEEKYEINLVGNRLIFECIIYSNVFCI